MNITVSSDFWHRCETVMWMEIVQVDVQLWISKIALFKLQDLLLAANVIF
jgi:hypothetical protein